MVKERNGYGFTPEAKKLVRERSQGQCDLSGDPHNNIVHHITGCYIAKLDGLDKDAISDPNLNASMLSDEMAEMHDKEEAYQVACLEYELKGGTIYEGKRYENSDFQRAKRNTNIRRRNKVLPRRNPHGRKGQLHWKRTTQPR